MMFNESKKRITYVGPVLNPALEEIRNSVLLTKSPDEEIAVKLKERTRRTHVTYLFHESGRMVLAGLCRIISATPTSPLYSSWKDLAGALLLSVHEIGCIENAYKSMDPTELILKTFAQNKDATLGDLVSALEKIKRYDAITYVKDGFEDLERIAREEQIHRTDEITKFYEVKGTWDGILRPDYYQNIKNSLPITLKDHFSKEKSTKRVLPGREVNNNGNDRRKRVSKFSKSVMLTFASDGSDAARRIAEQFRKPRGEHLPIGVLILDEHYEKVISNPEHFISHWFSQVNYVVPILTEGYLASLKEGHREEETTLSSVDNHYTQLIHDLMAKYYVANHCRNDKFRCIIPDDQFQRVLTHVHMSLDPVLKVYLKESETELLACRMLKIRSNIA